MQVADEKISQQSMPTTNWPRFSKRFTNGSFHPGGRLEKVSGAAATTRGEAVASVDVVGRLVVWVLDLKVRAHGDDSSVHVCITGSMHM